jgi:hypothetical protein
MEKKENQGKKIHLEGDILVNKTLELHFGDMIKTYCLIDERFQ